MTKKNEGLYDNYCRADARTIWDAYDRPSRNKERAYEWCLGDAREHGGYDIRIPSHSCHFFTFAYRYMKDGAERMRYHTHANVYDFALK